MTPSELSYREIPLTKGKVAIVDASDYEFLMQWKWYAKASSNGYYADRSIWESGKHTRNVRMHRQIAGAPNDSSQKVDHINGNTLDNRRSNLRICSNRENSCNQKKKPFNKSGYKGVCWCKKRRVWRATISVNRKQVYLGQHATREQAHAAYCEAAKRLHGEFANFG